MSQHSFWRVALVQPGAKVQPQLRPEHCARYCSQLFSLVLRLANPSAEFQLDAGTHPINRQQRLSPSSKPSAAPSPSPSDSQRDRALLPNGGRAHCRHRARRQCGPSASPSAGPHYRRAATRCISSGSPSISPSAGPVHLPALCSLKCRPVDLRPVLLQCWPSFES
jgi:hypothetical protein